MRMHREYKKLFYDLEKAKQFGNEVERIASEISVPAGKYTTYGIFTNTKNLISEHEVIGEHYYIDKDKSFSHQAIYYVRYSINAPRGATRADMLQAERQATENLNLKYKELGPPVGRFRT